MRVAFVTNILTGYRKTFYSKLARLRDVDLLVVHGFQTKETGRPDVGSGAVIPFRTTHIQNGEKNLGTIKLRWQKGALGAVRSYDPDAIVLLGISGTFSNWLIALYAKLLGKRLIMWSCGWEAQEKGSLALKLKKLFMLLYFKFADQHLVYSTKGKRYLEELNIRPERITVCYNGIEIDDYHRQESAIRTEAANLRREMGAAGRPVFLYVGGMLREKKVDLLLDAFTLLAEREKEAQLWLIGDGPDLPFFKEIAAGRPSDGIRFFGRIFDGVDKYFAAADFFVLPGLGGLALNQAMFWGIPCICSEADGTEDDLVLDGVTGYRFRKGDADDLVSAMERALRDLRSGSGAVMGAEAAEVIESRSNVTKMVETFDKAFKQEPLQSN